MKDLFMGKGKSGWRSFKLNHLATKIVLAVFMAVAFLLFQGADARAVSFTSDVVVGGTITFDDASAVTIGAASQGGSFTAVGSGMPMSSFYADTFVFGPNPVPAMLTDIGDGFIISGGGTASAPFGQFATSIGLGLDLMNTSATESYQLTFKVDFNHMVEALGLDASASSSFVVSDSGGDLVATSIGDGVMADAGVSYFDVILSPLAMTSISGIWQLNGQVLSDGVTALDGFNGGSAFGQFDAIFTVDKVAQPVPEPATMILLGSGLVGLAAASRRRRKA